MIKLTNAANALTTERAETIASLIVSMTVSKDMMKVADISRDTRDAFELASYEAINTLAVEHGIVLPAAGMAAVYVETYNATKDHLAAKIAVSDYTAKKERALRK